MADKKYVLRITTDVDQVVTPPALFGVAEENYENRIITQVKLMVRNGTGTTNWQIEMLDKDNNLVKEFLLEATVNEPADDGNV